LEELIQGQLQLYRTFGSVGDLGSPKSQGLPYDHCMRICPRLLKAPL